MAPMKRTSSNKHSRFVSRGIFDLWKRELGHLSPSNFTRRVAASEDLVLRFQIHRQLDKHNGCVNTVSFNADGDILVSGSDDKMIILWDWESCTPKLSFHSGHSNNVFQARFMPYSDDRVLVTCAADGEVRRAHIQQGGEVAMTLLGQHEGWAHKLAIEPGSPHIFYSCGEDGVVQHFDLRTKSATKLFMCKTFQERSEFQTIVHLNDITIDPRNPNLFAIGGTDEYARVYDIRKYKWDGSSDYGNPTNCFCPPHLLGDGNVGITGLAFSDQSELLVSYNDELIYIFTKDQGIGPNPISSSPDIMTDSNNEDEINSSTSQHAPDRNQSGPRVYKGHRNCETVKGVSFFGPNCEYVTSGSDCGRIFLWRKRDGKLLRAMEGDKYVVNCIEPHPYITVIASSGIEKDVKIWAPYALEPAPPVKLEEVLMADCFVYDSDDNDNDDDDDDDDSDCHLCNDDDCECDVCYGDDDDDITDDDFNAAESDDNNDNNDCADHIDNHNDASYRADDH